MSKRAKRRSSGGRAKKKAKKDDPLAELKALKAQLAAKDAEVAAQKEALAAQAEALQAKDETIANQAAEVAAKDAEVTTLQESISAAAFASPLLQGRARTANGCKAHAHGLLDVVERTSDPSKASLARCHTLRASLVMMRGTAVDALDAEGVKVIRDITRAVKNSIANQVFHIDTSLRRMRHSIDLQQMPLQNMIKQVAAAETLASAALASETPVSFGRRLATSTRNFLISDPDSALPKIHDSLETMEKTMKIEVDSTVWPRVRGEAMAAVERFAAGMVTAHGALHPIFEIQRDSNVMRRIMALAAPTAMSKRAERRQWARKLLALQPVMHQQTTVVAAVPAVLQASSSAAAAGSAAAPIALDGAAAAKKAKESLSLINVIAKDFLDKFTDYTAPSAEWAKQLNSWLAMVVMQERCVTLKWHTGKCAGLIGVYKLNEEHSAEGKDVYTNVVLSDMHLYRTKHGRWHVSKTEWMVERRSKGWIQSTTASDFFLDLKWKWADVTAGTWHDDPLLKVTETTAADRAVYAAETARVLAITTITVVGHTGVWVSFMGTYTQNAAHSPRFGGNVYTKTDNSDRHFFRGCQGDWLIGDTEDMVAGNLDWGIKSVKSSHSPLDLEWEFNNLDTGFQPDPLLKITGS